MKDVTIMSEEDAKERIFDLKLFGDTDAWKLICKAASASEGWYKTTKAMEIEDVGCLIQTETREVNNGTDAVLSQALMFVPNVTIRDIFNSDGKCIGRYLCSAKDNYLIEGCL
jgi:hypothetical protein